MQMSRCRLTDNQLEQLLLIRQPSRLFTGKITTAKTQVDTCLTLTRTRTLIKSLSVMSKTIPISPIQDNGLHIMYQGLLVVPLYVQMIPSCQDLPASPLTEPQYAGLKPGIQTGEYQKSG